MPPAAQMALDSTMNTNKICPATLTPDIFTSPSPATMKLSTRETRDWINDCSITGTPINNACR